MQLRFPLALTYVELASQCLLLCSCRLLLLAQQPGRFVVHPGVVHRAGELRHQDGAASYADPRQPHRGLRVRLLLRQRVHRLHETDALPRIHAHSLCPLQAEETGH